MAKKQPSPAPAPNVCTPSSEIARRHGENERQPGAAFRGSGDIYAHFRERLAAAKREEFYGILLDNKHRKLRDVLLSLGSLTASIVHPRLCVTPTHFLDRSQLR